jgi:multidrug efflux system outer membrane protein
MRRSWLIGLAVCLLAGCAVGSDYQRPAYPAPTDFRGEGPGIPTRPADVSLGDLRWFEVFKDPKLQELIRLALKENYDVRIAAQRVLEARQLVTATRSFLFPSVFFDASHINTRTSERGLTPVPPDLSERSAQQLAGDLTWELDFFGRIRRATEASIADFFASEENRNLINQLLVTNLARAYIELLEVDLELEIARQTLKSRQASYRLVKFRQEGGVDTMLAVRQAEGLVYGASQTIPDLQRLIEQKENEISTLLGRNPGKIDRGKLDEQDLLVKIPPGLPSSLLERRPDIRGAEQQLVAANARIGEAKALLFPQITLTASAGYQSAALSRLIAPASSFWTVIPALTQPIFTAGRLRANVRAAEARKQQALLGYQQTIQQAFREVSDSLIGYRKLEETRREQEKLVATLTDQTRLARLRYRGGVTSYLEVLDSERQLFDAELNLARAKGNELLAVIALYRALGGGWQVDASRLWPRAANANHDENLSQTVNER